MNTIPIATFTITNEQMEAGVRDDARQMDVLLEVAEMMALKHGEKVIRAKIREARGMLKDMHYLPMHELLKAMAATKQ